jgi:Glyoxalase/Bleomycin resistance protein/Dioxygenase superfamily
MVKTHGLSHVALAVLDLDRSLAFYSSVFGVREYFRNESTIRYWAPDNTMFLPLRSVPPVPVSLAASFTLGFDLPGQRTWTLPSQQSRAPEVTLLHAANSVQACRMPSFAIRMVTKLRYGLSESRRSRRCVPAPLPVIVKSAGGTLLCSPS